MSRPPRRPSRSRRQGRPAEGCVLRLRARHAFVQVGDDVLRCTLRKSLFRSTELTRPVAVGDEVELTVFGEQDAVVEEVRPRRSVLARFHEPSGRHQIMVANVDQVVITTSARDPDFRARLVDRILVAAEREDLEALIIVNKLDLVESEAERELLEEELEVYRQLDYPVVLSSISTGEGIEELRDRLRGKISAFSGHSGVGKSSLLNAIQPGLRLRTGEVSETSGKGRHTTTGATLVPLKDGGYVADTAGIRAFATHGLEAYQIGLCFREIAGVARACHFPTCTHDHEPDCAVKRAVEEGLIDAERYESYLVLIGGEGDAEEEEERGDQGA